MLNWDDLRVFIAVTRAGSFSSAGSRIGMDATTIARRIQRLETSLRSTLIVRKREGVELTAAGVRLSEAGAALEAAVDTAREEGGSYPFQGTVRLRVAEGFGARIVAPAISDFINRCPGLCVEMDASPGYLSPTTRKVDLAITINPPTNVGRLVVERLADYEVGLYASPQYLEKHGRPEQPEGLRGHQFVGYVDDLVYSDQLRFLDAFVPDVHPRLTCSSIKVQITLAASGAGVGAFPHFLVDKIEGLVPVLPELLVTRTFWMATHHELYEVARVRLVRDWLRALVAEHAGRFMPSKNGAGVRTAAPNAGQPEIRPARETGTQFGLR